MSLGTRLTLKTAALVLAVVVVAAAAIVGLNGLNRDLDAALVQYDRLREAYTLLSELEHARAISRDRRANQQQVESALMRPRLRLNDLDGPSALPRELREAVRSDLNAALAAAAGRPDTAGNTLALTAPINSAINRLAAETEEASTQIEQIERQADDHRAAVVLWVSLTAALAAVLAIIVGVWQYLAVMRPLRRLQRGVERLSSGDFTQVLRKTGDREFVALADDFNRMADELSTLYRELEGKVRVRSAQLAQSERLASVGFLAAGVAHEINNPLAIISGEAELALGALPPDADDDLRQALTTTRDEAFRCKAITQKLLSLARPGSGERECIDLNEVVESVCELVRTLPQHDGLRLSVQHGHGPTLVDADPAQLKQVLLNLVINAFEAVEPGAGRVRVIVGETQSSRCITVHDNGRGISELALSKIFEPFYTEKRSPASHGLGLGLSISHAIISDMGGRLYAQSPGYRGQGSSFTIELPIPEGGTTH